MDRAAFIRLCKERGTNASEIADRVGLNRNTIGRWLNGKSDPGLPAAYAVAECLETDVLTLWPRPRSAR